MKILVVRGYDDLKRLYGFRHPYDAIRVALPGLTEDANRMLEGEFQRDYFECGCEAGGYAMGLCVALGCVLFISTWCRTGAAPFVFLPWWLGMVLAVSLVTKVATILRARWRLVCRARQLAESSPHDDQRALGSGLALRSP